MSAKIKRSMVNEEIVKAFGINVEHCVSVTINISGRELPTATAVYNLIEKDKAGIAQIKQIMKHYKMEEVGE